jgi:predicted dehydrogenase
MTTVRWGVLSTANIGMEKVTPAIQKAASCEVVAIASRDLSKAEGAARRLGIAGAYGSYDALLAAGDVDAVYIPLPNDMHAPWVERAAAAGKHVLCEKPLAVSARQAEQMVDAARVAGILLMEAFMYRHHPTWVEAVRLVRDGRIGRLQAVQSWFGYYNEDEANIRNKVENWGGALMDIGCYAVNLSRLLFDSEPERVRSVVRRDPATGVDVVTSAILEFPGGGQSAFTCSIRAEDYQGVHIFGSDGRIEIEIPFNIPPDRETRINVTAGGDPPVAPATETITFPAADAYTLEAELFARSIIDGTDVPVPPADAVANMRVIEAIAAG